MILLRVAAGVILAGAACGAALAQRQDDDSERARAAANAAEDLERAEKKAANAEKRAKDSPITPYSVAEAAPDDAWRRVGAEDMLVLDMPAGPVVVELREDFAPAHVAQIKTLVRRGFYDGLTFHRVLEGRIAQGGSPTGDGTGESDLPDLKAEFVKDTKDIPDLVVIGRDRVAARVGFVDGLAVGAQPESLRSFRSDRAVEIWPLQCPGILAMARTSDPNSANSQFFVILGDVRIDFDRSYTVWGQILDGSENSRRIDRGDPPKRPTPIVRARIAADMPEAERPKIDIMRTDSESFKRFLDASGAVKDDYVKDACDIKAPRRINGKIEL